MVIDVADPLRGGQRRSGRIKSATTSSVVIDAVGDLNVNLSNSPKISVIMPNGLIETKTITGITGTTVNISGTGYALADLQVGDISCTTLTATNSLTGSSI